jgi:hypothetical protein
MTDASHAPATSLRSPRPSSANLDTTAGSAVHIFLRIFLSLFDHKSAREFAPTAVYVVAVALTYLPLLMTALLSGMPLTVTQGSYPLPFLYDVNVMFTFLVSFPCILILTASDQDVLTRALNNVLADGTVTIAPAALSDIEKHWFGVFRIVNVAAQALGLAIGGIVAYSNYKIFTPANVGHWIAHNGHLVPAGYVYLYGLVLLYAVVTVYAIRTFFTALLLRSIVEHAQLHMLPLHPDKAGGLQPVGRIGLRNQYALTVLGLNIVLFFLASGDFILSNKPVLYLIAALVAFYVLLGPFAFVAPLLPFRSGMLKNKAQLMNEVAVRLRVELDRLRARLPSGTITAEDEDFIERLRKVGAIIDELPVWPFDAVTLRKFLTAFALPIVTGIGLPLILEFIHSLLRS